MLQVFCREPEPAENRKSLLSAMAHTVDDIENRINRQKLEVKENLTVYYNDISNELKLLRSARSNPDRQRFLEKVRDSISIYLSPDENTDETINNPCYFILLYIAEKEYHSPDTKMDEDGRITVVSDGSVIANAMWYLLEKFEHMPISPFRTKHSQLEEMFIVLFKHNAKARPQL